MKILTCVSFLILCLSAAAAPPVQPSAFLYWTPSTSPNIAWYSIYYGNSPGVYTTRIYASGTNTTVKGLSYSKTYYFVATAQNMDGIESVYSNEVHCTTPRKGGKK